MCTAATYQTRDFYFGRTLDYEFSYGEEIVITPRSYPFSFRHVDRRLETHYAIIGMAHVAGGYPLYYDAVNEKGLGMAGLNFVESCRYSALQSGARNIAQFELIPWLLGRCASLAEARRELAALTVVGEDFSAELPAARLVLQVHDELIVECPEGDAARAAALLAEEMEHVAQLSVPLTADAHWGKNWLEAKG